MGWRYKAGLFFIAAVVFIWVASAEIAQKIFTEYQQPFALAYLGVSLMAIYLPIAALRDWIYNFHSTHSSDDYIDGNAIKWSSIALDSPLRISGMHHSLETEMRSCLTTGLDLSHREEGQPLIMKSSKDGCNSLRQDSELNSWDVAKCSFYIAPIWFATEYLSNAALARTSVASTTVLSSTSSLFTLFFGACLGQDSLNVSKVVAVLISIAGVAMTTLGKTWTPDDPQLSINRVVKHSIVGDVLGLFSAVSNSLFTGENFLTSLDLYHLRSFSYSKEYGDPHWQCTLDDHLRHGYARLSIQTIRCKRGATQPISRCFLVKFGLVNFSNQTVMTTW